VCVCVCVCVCVSRGRSSSGLHKSPEERLLMTSARSTKIRFNCLPDRLATNGLHHADFWVILTNFGFSRFVFQNKSGIGLVPPPTAHTPVAGCVE
jgi:hypothetical protein